MDFQRTRGFMCELLAAAAVFTLLISSTASHTGNPKFSEPIKNVTVPVGREAIFSCVIEDLGTYKVAWLLIDTQTILTIHNHLITKNKRFSVTHSENRTWFLHIRDVREHDRGWYMCQINTDPMISQRGYLDVVVSPDILDYRTSTDMVVSEGSNVTLRCEARGYPTPHITWKREGGEKVHLQHGLMVTSKSSTDGPILVIDRVNRRDMGPYLCIASNGVPPSVSKRIMLIVNFPPSIRVVNQLLGAYDGLRVVLECHSEAFPRSINYWTKDSGEIVPQNEKFHSHTVDTENYRVEMKLVINNISRNDFGTYHCISKNTVGEAEGTIKIYRIQSFNFSNEATKSGVYQADMSRKDSLFLGDGYYSSAERDHVNPLLATALLYSLTSVTAGLSVFML